MNVVVVESPAKAKTINKYLGGDYQVLASYGHVRDLPSKEGSVSPEHDFSMAWSVDSASEKRIKEIVAAVKKADTLILATDPDREGEAISWHISEELTRRKVLKGKKVQRVVFNEVTQKAILDAFGQPRELNRELVEAYLARRALDYLFGFTLSPVLWRKLPGSRSAGRVQSVALRTICERESEIEQFKPQEYWSVKVKLNTPQAKAFSSRLTHLKGDKLDKFSLGNAQIAADAASLLEEASSFTVTTVEQKKSKRNPYPPFTTSSLQQEASRKLGFGASRTMRIAQNLYEGKDIGGETVGLITYMRTDSVSLSGEAIASARNIIAKIHGEDYLPANPRAYKSKAKNAQEAHEAIRPTDLARFPKDLLSRLDSDSFKLYELIWNRTMASQMESAVLDQVAVDIDVDQGAATLRASGSVVAFDGYMKIYEESRDDQKDDRKDDAVADKRLPKITKGDRLKRESVSSEQHFTQPPPRYSEASLVKRMEELGIGRPSTYASIIQVLQDRSYVRLESKRFIPESRGRIVTTFLENFFSRYVEYNFTADMETSLDDISAGEVDWKVILHDFWEAFNAKVSGTEELTITEVIERLDEELGPYFFPQSEDAEEAKKTDPRKCPSCEGGRLGIKLGRTGGFIGCSSYPDCRYTRPLGVDSDRPDDFVQPKEMGLDEQSGLMITLRKGPYGLYLQLGEAEEKKKPKRVAVPKDMTPQDVTQDVARGLIALPREVGEHPEDGLMITAGIGRFGPYVKHDTTYKALRKGDDVLFIGLNRAVSLLAEVPKRGAVTVLKTLGKHPEDEAEIAIYDGRFGPYVKWNKLNASLPKGREVENFSLEEALELLAKQAAKKGSKKKNNPKATEKSATKATAKKATEARKKSAAKSQTTNSKAKKSEGR